MARSFGLMFVVIGLLIGLVGNAFSSSLLVGLHSGFGVGGASPGHSFEWRSHSASFEGGLGISELGVPPVPGGGSYVEDFLTSTYLDATNTTAVGWGSGPVRLPRNSPTLIGSYYNWGMTQDIFVDGDYVYASGAFYGLYIIDISNPALPSLASFYSESSGIFDVWVSGDFAYLANWGNGLLVLNVTDPTSPSLAGSCDTPDFARSVVVSGDYCYIADDESGLQVIDITDPTAPTLVGAYDTPGNALGVFVCGDFAYIADGSSGGLQVINITVPSSPSFVGWYNTPGTAWSVEVSGNYAYVADATSGLQVLDITDPSFPSYVSSYDTPDQAYDLSVSGNFAYLADPLTGLMVMNITDPSQPSLVGSYDSSAQPRFVTVCRDVAYVTDMAGQGLMLLQIADYISPSLVGSYDTPDLAQEVCLGGNYGYIADTSSGLQVLNITNPAQPQYAGSYNTPGMAYGVTVNGKYTYIADGDAGLLILNVTVPSSPSLVGSYNTIGQSVGVVVSGNYAYVADGGGGLQVINITDPTSPSLAGFYLTPSESVYGVFMSGDFVYLAMGATGLLVLDISDPSSPSLTGSYNTPGAASDGVVWGNYAYVADASSMLVLDITDPSTPSLAGSYATPSSPAVDVFVCGDFAYVADSGAGLLVLDISDPSSPSLLGSYDTPDLAYDVFVWGDFAYVADLTTGLLVVEVQRNRCRQYVTPATAQSLSVYSSSSELVLWANLSITATLPSGTSIAYQLTADNGVHWETVPVGMQYTFSNPGSHLRWRAVFSTSNTLKTPTLENLSVIYATKLSAPTLITPNDGIFTPDSTPTFNWSSVTGAIDYQVQLDTASSFDTPDLRNVTGVTPTYTPTLSLDDGLWYWRVAGNDSAGDLGYFSAHWNLTIDTIAPTWDQVIADQVVEFGAPFFYDLDASDPAGIDTWWLNDTTHFAIDATGAITNALTLGVSTYGVQVWVNDTLNNVQTATFTVTVLDTTDPTWQITPIDQVVTLGSSFAYDVTATDLAGIDHYWINDTTHFAIDSSGQITNATSLLVGRFGLEVRAYDASNNYCSATISVTVEAPPPPPPPGIPPELVLVVLVVTVVGVVGVLGFILYYRRRPS